METLVTFRDDCSYAGSGLSVKSKVPLNAEPVCPARLTESWITPASLAFQRNHGPIIHFDPKTYKIVLEVHEELAKKMGWQEQPANGRTKGKGREMSLGLDELRDQEWPTREVVAALQCAGNRRDEMSGRGGKTEGLGWGNAVINNGRWKGYLLRPLLLSLLRLPPDTNGDTLPAELKSAHVEFEADQPCQEDDKYAGSIPLREAVDKDLPLMLAFGLNGEDLPVERGGPLRIVVPGHIGARSVKWVTRVIVSPRESGNFYQQRDYKVLDPSIRTTEAKELAMANYPALQNFGITSVITFPFPSTPVTPDSEGLVKVKGYALGSRGVALEKVELCVVESQENGEGAPDKDREKARQEGEWVQSKLKYEDEEVALDGEAPKRWGWYLFEGRVKPLSKGRMTFVSRAVDVNGDMQPCMCPWNIRGVEERSWSLAREVTLA